MTALLIFIYAATIVATFEGSIAIGWLTAISLFTFLYCLVIFLSKESALTTVGKVLFVCSVLTGIYCICIIRGINIMSLF